MVTIQVSSLVANACQIVTTHLHYPLAMRQLPPCMHQGRSSLPWDILQKIRLNHCMLPRCSFAGVHLCIISLRGNPAQRAQPTYSRELFARNTDHGKFSNFSTSSKVEECKANDSDLFIRLRGTTSNETSCVLARTNLQVLSVPEHDCSYFVYFQAQIMHVCILP